MAAPEIVAAALRDRILTGELAPGTPLREVVLAQEFGVSRNTFREAVHHLATENLVDVRRHRGAVVHIMATDDIRDLYRVRRVIESQAVTEGADTDPRTLAGLITAVEDCERAAAAENWREAETTTLRFHQSLVATLGSARLDAFFTSVIAQTRLAFSAIVAGGEFQRGFVSRDRELLTLLSAGDRAGAAAALRRYLDDAERKLIELVRLRAPAAGRARLPLRGLRDAAECEDVEHGLPASDRRVSPRTARRRGALPPGR